MNEYIDELKQPIIGNSFQIISQINKELQNNNIINLNYLLLKMSVVLSKDVSISKDELANIVITEVNKLLVKYSDTFKEIYDNEEFSDAYLFINGYMNKVLKYYDELMMTNQDKFDRYVETADGNQPKKKVILKENLYMTIEDIQNTMQ